MNTREEYVNLIDDIIDYIKTGFRSKKANHLHINKKEDKTVNNQKFISKKDKIAIINKEIISCKKCSLHLKRINAVPGDGSVNADIMFIGEGPGEMEDIKGKPFVGRAGELLTKMLLSINLKRDEVYITNIVKCRPPDNRTPLPEEVAYCFPYLESQIGIINPMIICCLGSPAIKTLIKTNIGISKLRGKFYRYKNIPVIPTFHPAAVLRFPDKYKRDVWNDLKMLRDFYRDIEK